MLTIAFVFIKRFVISEWLEIKSLDLNEPMMFRKSNNNSSETIPGGKEGKRAFHQESRPF